MRDKEIWSFAGAGGKTSGIFFTAGLLRQMGLRVLVTTTTHMELPVDRAFVPGEEGEALKNKLLREGYAIAGNPVSPNKMGGVGPQILAAAAGAADVVLVEADGSARHPFKVPAGHEPVILPGTTKIWVTAGLSALGKPVRLCCHRSQQVASMLGVEENHLLCAADMARCLYHGYLRRMFERFPGVQVIVVLNQADDGEACIGGRQVRTYLEHLLCSGERADIEVVSWQKLLEGGEGWENLNKYI